MAYGSEVEKLERRWMENPMGVSFAPLAEAYRRAGDQPRALEVLAIGLANHPAYVPALIVQARCHLDVQADGAAEESFLAVLATDGHNLIALKGLADICERSDRPEQATKHLDRLLEADPTHDEGRIQMDRLTGILVERERLRGGGAGTASIPASEMSVIDTEELESVEPIGFEPTDAGSQDDAAGPSDPTSYVESLVDSGEEPALEAGDAGSDPERSEPELIASVGWEEAVAEPVAGFVASEPEFVVEKDSDPFEAPDAGEPLAPAGLGDTDSAMPFEEELPAPWLQESADEPLGDAFRDELPVELPVEADPPSAELELESEAPLTESESPPALGDPVWAPMGSAWASEEAREPAGEAAIPPEDDAQAGEAPWAAATAAEPTLEPEQEGEQEPETVYQEATDPEALESHAEDAGAREFTEEVVSEVVEDRELSPAAEYAEPVEPATWQDPASEVVRDAEDADEAVALVEGADSELPADPEPEIEPALIMTETMARLFERQGHRTMALAIYAQLAEQAPDNLDLASAVERLTGELSAGAGRPGAVGKGGADASAVDAIAGRNASGPAHRKHRAPSDSPDPGLRLDAPATRASEDLFSLSAVFGPARPAVTAPSAVVAPTSETDREPSFDEFFGSEESAPSDGGRTARASGEDLEQFTAWLRSLKR